jgi:hypothetical protein
MIRASVRTGKDDDRHNRNQKLYLKDRLKRRCLIRLLREQSPA